MGDKHSSAPGVVDTARHRTRVGLGYGLAAYLMWGMFPLYLKGMGTVPAGEVLAHRIVWSLLLLGLVIAVARRWAAVRTVLASRKLMGVLLGTAVLIAINWLVYTYAVFSDRLLSASLGYYLNPLVSVAMGVVVLKERLSRAQGGAIVLALAGIAVLAANAGGSLWISLVLALSFATYGLLRKMAPVDPLTGLAVETAILAPLAAGYLLWRASTGQASFGEDRATDLLLLASGAATAAPLLLFSAAAKRLRYATVGMLQFIAPSLQFALAVWLYGEPLTGAHLVCFGAIWAAVAIYVADALRLSRTAPAPAR